MKIDKNNTIYVFKDNEKMDCPENVITHVCLDDVSDLSHWFEVDLKGIKEKYFIQFIFENGSIIKCFSGKEGHVKSIKLWYFNEVYADGKRLDYFLCTPTGMGSKHISYHQFISLFQSENLINGNYKKDFTWRTRSHEGDTNPKEPLFLINLRLNVEKDKQKEINDKVPDFDLKTLGIKPYKVKDSINEKSHLITTKQNSLLFLEDSADSHSSNYVYFMHIDFIDNQNKKPQGQSVSFYVGKSGYGGFNVKLDIYLNECDISASKNNVGTLETIVDLIFNLSTCDNSYLISEYKVKEVKNKKIKPKPTKKSIITPSLDKLENSIDLSAGNVIYFEANSDDFLSIAPISIIKHSINFSYPSDISPKILLKELGIDIPESLKLNNWSANSTCIFEFNIENMTKGEIAQFVFNIFKYLFHIESIDDIGIDIENMGEVSESLPFDDELYELFLDSGIEIAIANFSDPEKLAKLINISKSELFEEIKKLYSKMEFLYDEGSGEEVLKDKLSTSKSLFYKMCELYSTQLLNFLPDDERGVSWEYHPIKSHFDHWLTSEYLEMVCHYRSSMKKPDAYKYLDERLDDLKRVIQQVSNEPGIERKNLYKILELNGRSYGSIITNVLVDNGLIMEEQTKSKRMLYPSR